MCPGVWRFKVSDNALTIFLKELQKPDEKAIALLINSGVKTKMLVLVI